MKCCLHFIITYFQHMYAMKFHRCILCLTKIDQKVINTHLTTHYYIETERGRL
jgi:hypothetical protein